METLLLFLIAAVLLVPVVTLFVFVGCDPPSPAGDPTIDVMLHVQRLDIDGVRPLTSVRLEVARVPTGGATITVPPQEVPVPRRAADSPPPRTFTDSGGRNFTVTVVRVDPTIGLPVVTVTISSLAPSTPEIWSARCLLSFADEPLPSMERGCSSRMPIPVGTRFSFFFALRANNRLGRPELSASCS